MQFLYYASLFNNSRGRLADDKYKEFQSLQITPLTSLNSKHVAETLKITKPKLRKTVPFCCSHYHVTHLHGWFT